MDARRVRADHAPSVLATLTNPVLAIFPHHGLINIARARRDCQWNPNDLAKLILTTRNGTLPTPCQQLPRLGPVAPGGDGAGRLGVDVAV